MVGAIWKALGMIGSGDSNNVIEGLRREGGRGWILAGAGPSKPGHLGPDSDTDFGSGFRASKRFRFLSPNMFPDQGPESETVLGLRIRYQNRLRNPGRTIAIWQAGMLVAGPCAWSASTKRLALS